jgi:hypothetical protein
VPWGLIYDEVDGPGVIALRRDASGEVNELLPQLPVFEFQRVPWHESKNLIYPILEVALGLPILTVLCWPVALVVRKRYHRPLFTTARDRVIYFLSRVVCFLELGYVVILGVLLSRARENVSLLGDGLDPWLKLLHILGWSIAAIIVLIISAARFWKTRGLGWWPRTHATLLVLSGVAFILIAWHWHLLDASTKF